jgi:hypothetical protein
VPVVGLKSWPLTTSGEGKPVDDAIIQADSPADAVEKAIAAGEARLKAL